MIISSLVQTQSCLKEVTENRNVEFEATSATLDTFTTTWRATTFSGTLVEHVKGYFYDEAFDKLEDDSWCSPATDTVTSVTPGAMSDFLCTYYDDSLYQVPFTPNTATTSSGDCADTAPTWIYSVDDTPIQSVRNNLQVSIDSETNMLNVRGLSGETTTADYTITINGVIPQTQE